jgi:hypothetical protein
MASVMKIETFIGSRGWLCNFCKRNDLVLRRLTNKGRQLPLKTKEIIQRFHLACCKRRIPFDRSEIYNMDETNIELDAPGNYTLEQKGAKHVYATTAGHEKVI